MEASSNEAKLEERLPWHKPEIQRLTVSLDTALDTISGADFAEQGLLD